MSRLAIRKRRARFETGSVVFDRKPRAVMLDLRDDAVLLWLKGNRRVYAMSYAVLYDLAMKRALTAEATMRRLAKRKATGGA